MLPHLQVAKELSEGFWGGVLDVAQGVLSIVAVVLYVYATYDDKPPGADGDVGMTWMDHCEIALAIFFLFEAFHPIRITVSLTRTPRGSGGSTCTRPRTAAITSSLWGAWLTSSRASPSSSPS